MHWVPGYNATCARCGANEQEEYPLVLNYYRASDDNQVYCDRCRKGREWEIKRRFKLWDNDGRGRTHGLPRLNATEIYRVVTGSIDDLNTHQVAFLLRMWPDGFWLDENGAWYLSAMWNEIIFQLSNKWSPTQAYRIQRMAEDMRKIEDSLMT